MTARSPLLALMRHLAVLAMLLAAAGCGRQERDPERLRFGVPPLGDAQATQRIVDPIAAWLGHSLGMPIDVVNTDGPIQLIELFRAGKLDLVLCSAVPVIELSENPGIDVLATRVPSRTRRAGNSRASFAAASATPCWR